MIDVTSRKTSDKQGAQEEAKRVRLRVSDVSSEIMRLKAENGGLEARVHELEQQVAQETKVHQGRLAQRDAELEAMQQKMAAQLYELKELMDMKLRLDAEIAAYRRLLEGEESRLVQQASSQQEHMQQAQVTPARYPGGAAGGGMKIISSQSSSKSSFQKSSKGPVTFAEVSAEGKFITLENTSKLKDINVEGWKVRRVIDNAVEKAFVFPPHFILKAGRTVKIWANGARSLPPRWN
ncbi:PREDICTED: muscle cell intermediate filament protein OV71-like [Priapulus caudatus]|uniref:Muscle cell intermediate filament protein OV71-like n=1 Tax=Priapulus caudatus TaxID=37621 RepID=A0ABM1F3X7_PRICU|nr:PREDICTED: muscle cell intermediate filament protein OV71-like [Priapulus caudatus]